MMKMMMMLMVVVEVAPARSADYSSNGLDGAGNTTARPERKA